MGIEAKHVGKALGVPPTRILTDISLTIDDGEFLAITGRSGSGKSSLLYLLSSLDNPSEGAIEVDGNNLKNMRPDELCQFRNRRIGFVFQFHYLLGELNALENVLLPARKAGQATQRQAHALSLLEEFGLSGLARRLPRQLSGGEQQRLAIARALVMEPAYLFADEPTGSLDSENSETVMRIIRQANEKRKTTVLMVTHDAGFAALARRQIYLTDGRITQERRAK